VFTPLGAPLGLDSILFRAALRVRGGGEEEEDGGFKDPSNVDRGETEARGEMEALARGETAGMKTDLRFRDSSALDALVPPAEALEVLSWTESGAATAGGGGLVDFGVGDWPARALWMACGEMTVERRC